MKAKSSPLAAAPSPPARAGLDWPGARTFRSPAFRTLLAATTCLVVTALLAMVLLRQAADPDGQYAFDFQAYHAAAADVAAGRSPYAPEMLDGPIPAQGAVLFKYPPTFAQVLAPLALLSLDGAAAAWLVLQAVMLLAAVWIALAAGGARRTLEAFCWAALAVALFLPAFDTLWKGNVSGLLALLVAVALVGGRAGGLGAGGAVLVKTTPLVLLAPVLLHRRALAGAALLLPVLAVSVVLSPAAWYDFARILPNLVEGAARFPTNLAIDNVAAMLLPTAPVAADVARLLSLGAGGGAVLASIVLARHEGGWPAAITLAVTAMLLLPSSTWYHYLAVLLPVAAFAWPRARTELRLAMIAGAGLVSMALLWLPMALVGAGLLLSASLVALWPRGAAAAASIAGRRSLAALRARLAEPGTRRRVLFALSALGYALGLAALALLVGSTGGLGYDSHAYWLAGQNVLEGQPLYWPHDEGALGAYRYPPLFAQLWAPFTLLPALAFSWLWRLVCFAALRYLAGSWRNVGLWLLVPFVWTELSIANVTFPVAALCVMALRGQASGVAWAGALKFGPVLLMPYLWLRRPESRRSMVLGAVVLLLGVGASYLFDPAAWHLYAQALTWMGASTTDSFGVIRMFDSPVVDAAARAVLGIGLVAIALYRGSDRLAFTATIIAAPVLAVWRLTPLLALPRLGRDR